MKSQHIVGAGTLLGETIGTTEKQEENQSIAHESKFSGSLERDKQIGVIENCSLATGKASSSNHMKNKRQVARNRRHQEL